MRPHWWQHSHDYLDLQQTIAFDKIRVQLLLERDTQLCNMLWQAFGSGKGQVLDELSESSSVAKRNIKFFYRCEMRKVINLLIKNTDLVGSSV